MNKKCKFHLFSFLYNNCAPPHTQTYIHRKITQCKIHLIMSAWSCWQGHLPHAPFHSILQTDETNFLWENGMRENINASENVFKCSKRSLKPPYLLWAFRIVWWPGCQCFTEHNQRDPQDRKHTYCSAYHGFLTFQTKVNNPVSLFVFKVQWIYQHAVVCEPSAGCECLQLW